MAKLMMLTMNCLRFLIERAEHKLQCHLFPDSAYGSACFENDTTSALLLQILG